MHLITTNVPLGRLDEVKDGLRALGVARMRIAQVNGYTEGLEMEVVWRGCRMLTHLLPEYELEAVVCSESVDDVVDLIIKIVRQGPRGDGFVCVTPVEQCYRIGTGHPQF
jgi:nitrogen regulatory protein P-II 1